MSDWDERIEKAEKFLDKAHTHGRKVYGKYENKCDTAEDLGWIKKANFFYANVNTLKESLFNSLPKPDVSRVQKGSFEDDVSRVAALIVQRGLTYEIACAPDFEESITSAILDRLVPGIGQVWISFVARTDEEGGVAAQSEEIRIEQVFWEDFIYSPARKWSKVWWVGRRLHLDKEEFIKKFGEEEYNSMSEGDTEGKGLDNLTPKEITENKICVYEIWNKRTKKVSFIVKGKEDPLKEVDDPYKLKNFFPCPRPLIANVTTNKFLPVTDYHIAQDQYETIDILYARIEIIVKAIKVAGLYDAAAPQFQRLFESGENMLIPVDDWAMYSETGGIKGHMDFYPVQEVAQVLALLQAQFEASKAVLYEITGMSDILRGASNPYETKGAQQIKAQFASVRMNAYQRDVAVFVRDSLRIISELMCQLYSIEKLQAIVGELAPPDMQYAEQAVEVLRDDILSHYKVDIQANSLTQADWALEKEQRMEVVTNLGQMLQAVMGLASEMPDIAVLGVHMIKFAVAGFKGASEFEGYVDQQLDNMLRKQQEAEANPQPPKPSPEEMKAQAEQQKMQTEMQMKQQESEAGLAMDQQKMQMEMQIKQLELQFEQQKMQMELAHKERMFSLEIEMRQQEMAMKTQEQALDLSMKEANAAMDMEVKSAGAAMDLDHKEKAQEFADKNAKPPKKGDK